MQEHAGINAAINCSENIDWDKNTEQGMGANGRGKMETIASEGTAPSMSFDAGMHSSDATDENKQTASRWVHTLLIQTQARLLSVSHEGSSANMF